MNNGFVLRLFASDRWETIDDVTSFMGEDRSGSFSIWPHHARFMTTLTFGLARYRVQGNDEWEYIALPGGLLCFVANELLLTTRQYFRDRDYRQIQTHLHATLQREEQTFARTREQLQQLEREMFQRLFRLQRSGRF